jgi:hypothetical protein
MTSGKQHGVDACLDGQDRLQPALAVRGAGTPASTLPGIPHLHLNRCHAEEQIVLAFQKKAVFDPLSMR